MFRRLFLWRRRPTPQPDELGKQAATSPHSEPLLAEQNAPESTSMPLKMFNEPNKKSLRTLVVVSSNAAPVHETECDAPDLQLKPIPVLPALHNPRAREGETTEKQSTDMLPAKAEESPDIPETGRTAYFAPGRYVSSEPDRSRLTSPDRIVRKKRFDHPRASRPSEQV